MLLVAAPCNLQLWLCTNAHMLRLCTAMVHVLARGALLQEAGKLDTMQDGLCRKAIKLLRDMCQNITAGGDYNEQLWTGCRKVWHMLAGPGPGSTRVSPGVARAVVAGAAQTSTRGLESAI